MAATAALVAAAYLLSACGGSSAGSEIAAGSPVSGGTLTFYDPIQYVAWNATNSTWSNSNVTDNLAERLIWQDPATGDFKPWLAASWEISPDHLVYTFHLRKGVTFSNGDPLDAETVKLNFDQHGLGDTKLAIPPDSFWANYKGTKAIDPQTVQVTLTKPNAGFLQVLSNYRASSILGKPYLKQDLNGQSKLENWVGTGPFVVEKVDGTTGVTLKRRDDYNWAPEGSGHQGKAYLESIVFKTVPEAGTRVGALQSGEAQIARNIAPYDEQTVAAGGGKVDAIPVQGETNKLAFELDANPLTQDKNIRLALQAATDREEINKTVLSPSYPVPTSLLVKGTPLRGDSSKYLTYDLGKANSLLDADGWTVGPDGIRNKFGKRLHFDIWVSPYYQVSQPVLELLQSQWKKAGVELKINSASLTEYQALEAARGDKWSFVQGQTSTGEPSVLRASYGSDRYNVLHSPKPDAKLDTLLTAQALQFAPAKRKAAIQAIEDYILGQGYVIPLYDETQVFGLGPKVQGFGTESTGRSWFYNTWLSK
ncbi:peptide/nickel transport system substrate-binding protein [Kribbella aluminosa]|uniref:Peptide/nickel transport system substrate-binding protein n=1 Tax=Kribbella aluminosa TaxID=416017 RepID=A0ABS4UJT9_9ACTN|nr:ABC transporter substrate-binding protein [Kribbella aluminosa]MBP2351870.1 peptide/nickel transport system substrate-binding protein [Kribbella aluminosa]